MTLPEAKAIVRSAGCTAEVSAIPSDDFNAYYFPGSHQILLIGFDAIPDSWQRFTLLHETGHCLQAQDSRFAELYARGPYEVEWDADAYAIRTYSELYGKDGADLNHEIWSTLYAQYGVLGREDEPHGLRTERITRGNLNRWIFNTEVP